MCRDEHRDLSDLLAEVRYTVQDSRFLWCTASIGFETTVTREHGIVIGGAMSPMFLLDQLGTEIFRPPWTVSLYMPLILVLRKEDASSLEPLIPMLEAVAKKKESLLVVAEKMDPTVLETLIVNFRRDVLSCCAVFNGSSSEVAMLANVRPTSLPTTLEKLPRASKAWVRRGATVIFPEPDDNKLGSSTREIVVVNISGTDVDNQLARMRAFMKALSREKDAFV